MTHQKVKKKSLAKVYSSIRRNKFTH